MLSQGKIGQPASQRLQVEGEDVEPIGPLHQFHRTGVARVDLHQEGAGPALRVVRHHQVHPIHPPQAKPAGEPGSHPFHRLQHSAPFGRLKRQWEDIATPGEPPRSQFPPPDELLCQADEHASLPVGHEGR